jgi:hormone-sensitive lipase
MTVYNDLPHGFLNYDAPQGMKEARTCVDDAANYLDELLKL